MAHFAHIGENERAVSGPIARLKFLHAPRSGGGCSDCALSVPVSGLVGSDCQVGGRSGGGHKVVG